MARDPPAPARGAAAARRGRARGQPAGRRPRRAVPREGSEAAARRRRPRCSPTIEQMCDGVAALITAHPAPPVHARVADRRRTRSSGSSQRSPEALWPFVSNTEKMNRATGLAPVRFEIESIGRGARRGDTTGNQRVAGHRAASGGASVRVDRGQPPRRAARVRARACCAGTSPRSSSSALPGGGTKLRNTIKLEPRGLLARVLSKCEIGVKYKRKLEQVYTRLDRVLAAGPRPEIDPIDPEVVDRRRPRARGSRRRASELLDGRRRADARSRRSTSYLLHASDQDVARIRPLELAAKFGVPEDAMIEACAARGEARRARDGVGRDLPVVPDPVDRSSSRSRRSRSTARCKTCNIGFDVDFSRAIELAFRASPEHPRRRDAHVLHRRPGALPARRRAGPAAARRAVRAAALARRRATTSCAARSCRARTSSASPRRAACAALDLTLGERTDDAATLTAGDQLLTLVNPEPREIVVRVERAGDRAFALTAARVMATRGVPRAVPRSGARARAG